jgi:hemerythrin-like domain-containing protein
MEIKPIKRNVNLTPLSKDHHLGLLACWKIKRGIEANINPGRIKKYVLFFWENYLKIHFIEEETLLFELITDDKITAAKQQHESIRGQITKLTEPGDASYVLLNDLAEALKDHIRYEERILFPFLERNLTNKQLAIIGYELNATSGHSAFENYPDEFWQPGAPLKKTMK